MPNNKKLGEKLFLSLQLGDGGQFSNQVRVFATIYDNSYNVLTARFEIFEDVANSTLGLYEETALTYPAEDVIKVQWEITKNNGTDLTNKYSPNVVTEEFVRDFTGELISAGGNSGKLITDKLTGKISPKSISGGVSENEKLTGSLSDGKVVVSGILKSCEQKSGTIT